MAGGGGRNFNFKCVLLGEGCVGKTSCVLRYVENKFNEKHLTTLQVSLSCCLWYISVIMLKVQINFRML
jgi:hypothetical protein